jgi:putative transposase
VPRKPREEVAGGVYHVFARGVNRRSVFLDDGDCQVYLVTLRGVIAVFGWHVLSYCLMTNHVHLVIETPYPNLGRGMQRLHGHYGRHFNRRHDRLGHLFERRFGHNPIKSDAQLCATLAYVAENPVDAGLCARPEDWRRSSDAATKGMRDDYCLSLERLREIAP